MWPRGRPRVSIDRYEGFVFAAAALAEDVDLDVGRRKEILFADAHLARWSHWEVLDLPWNAPAAAAKAAYLEKAKLFHPDRYAGRRLGSYRARLERIFRKVTAARDVLGDEAKRAAYAQASASPEEFARREARRLDDERRAEERRARLARHNPLLARTARVTELVRRGKAALAEGRFGQAANDLIVAQGLDPQNAAVSALAAEARKKAAAAKGLELFRNGLEAEALGNASAALASYREAIEADPANARAAAHGARTAAQLGDAAGARALVDGALRTNPRSALVHEALGIVLELEGNKKDARKAFERALELDPKLDSAKERLKKLRWGFLG
jgi:curved DNA-binding protein CbpA